ncbi:MAG TPA: hypothetical protein VEI49_11545 [Terriglobales bacterium]|nr:hypothetical protein [Terriglobales bacterium]
MSIQKKSLISNRVTVKKALIANQPSESQENNPLKANSLTAQSMKKKRLGVTVAKQTRLRIAVTKIL